MIKIVFPILLFALSALSQDLPKKIRGYTVHREPITISTGEANDPASDVLVKLGDPTLADIALEGLSFDLAAEITPRRQSGKVDFLTFHDLRINGISVEIDEYKHPFGFRKNETVTLAAARILVPTTQVIKAGWKELRDSRTEWTITGRIFVFGKFRKFGFMHRRVVPVDIEFKIKNPLIVGSS